MAETRHIITWDRLAPRLSTDARIQWADYLGRHAPHQRRWHALFGEFVPLNASAPSPLPIDTQLLPPDRARKLASHIPPGDPEGILYHGDNLGALHHMLPRFAERIHTIYIDPPYNTGHTHFDYPDRRADEEWESLIAERLDLARRLMHPEGALFVSIDDRQIPTLRTIARRVGLDFVAAFVRRSGVAPRQDARLVAVEHDYVVMFARSIRNVRIQHLPADLTDRRYPYEDEFVAQRGRFTLNKLDRGSIRYSPTMDYPIVIRRGSPIDVIEPGARRPVRIPAPETIELWPGGDPADQQWTWRWSKSKVEWGLQHRMIVFRRTPAGWRIYFKQYQRVDNRLRPIRRTVPPRTLLLDYPNENATRTLRHLFGRVAFTSYPKPVELIEYLIALNAPPDGWVLDFFAGSGTTAHAVINLNAAEDARRRFILVESQDYFHSVILPRIQKIAYARRWKNARPLDPAQGPGGLWRVHDLITTSRK